MGKIVAIGGGELKSGQTERIDRYIVELAGKESPRLLFVPTALSDNRGYIGTVKRRYREYGAGRLHALCLITKQYAPGEIEELFDWADIIYVGGGDTRSMIAKWREFSVDRLFYNAYEQGKVLCGLSAGSICWFVAGHSDSEAFHAAEGESWSFIRTEGIGMIPALNCPHYDEPGRHSFDAMMEGESLPGIALENNTALTLIDGRYSIIKSDESRSAYLLRNEGGRVTRTELAEGEEFTL